ncbi:hypothetical protein ES703_34000 [subsurface metagenome]
MTGVFSGGLRDHQSRFSAGHSGATGLQHQDIILDEFLDHLKLHIVGNPGIVTADDTGYPPYAAVNNVIVQWSVGSPEDTTQQVINRLMAKSSDEVTLFLGNLNILAPVGEVINGRLDYGLGRLNSVVFVKLNVAGPLYLGPGVSGHNLGVVALGNIGQPLHNALDINHHSLDGPSDYGQLLLQEIAGDGHAVAHQYLVGCAAHTGQVYPLGPLGFGILGHLRVLSDDGHHLGQLGLVTVNDNIHLILFEHTQVYLTEYRCRSAEHNILELSGQHAASPAIGQGGSCPLKEQVLVVLVNPHVGAVHRLDHFPVYTPWGNPQPPPQFLALQGCPPQEEEFPFLLAKLVQRYLANIGGYSLITAVANFNTKIHGQL